MAGGQQKTSPDRGERLSRYHPCLPAHRGASLMDHRHACRQVRRLARLVVLKPVTGLHPAHSTVAGAMLAPVRCAALRGMPAWERRRRIFSGYGSLSSSLRRRLPSYSLAAERLRGNNIALSGKMKRAATGVVTRGFSIPLISRNQCSAGVCTLPCVDAGGLPGVVGPFSLSHS